jgi:hypothetical protein
MFLTISGNEFFDSFDEFVPMSVGDDSDLFKVLVVHLGQDVDADLLAVENLPKLFQTQTEKVINKKRKQIITFVK